jgi:hypothetical protein
MLQKVASFVTKSQEPCYKSSYKVTILSMVLHIGIYKEQEIDVLNKSLIWNIIA